MNLKNKFKKILIIIATILIILSIFNICFATDSYDSVMKNLVEKTESTSDPSGTNDKVSSTVSVIITATRIIGVCVAVVMLLVVAMKYMTSAPGDKAEIKKSAVVYVVGALVLFGAVGILTIIGNFATKNINIE